MIKRVLPIPTLVTMITVSAVFSGCIDPYPTTHHYQSSSPTTRYYYSTPAPRYVAPNPVYVAPTPLYAPQQPQTKVIIVEQPRYRDSSRMERHHPYDNDHGDNYRNNSSRMELQPNRSGDTYRNGSNRPVQPVIQPHIDNRPTFQPHMDNHPRRDSNGSVH